MHYWKWGTEVSCYCRTNFPFHSVSGCFRNLEALIVGCTYVFKCYIFLVKWRSDTFSLYSVLLCLVAVFDFKCLLSDASLAIPTLFCMEYLFSPFTFTLCVILGLKWIFYRQSITGSCFLNPFCQSVIFFLSVIWFKFNALVITYKKELIVAILLFSVTYSFFLNLNYFLPVFLLCSWVVIVACFDPLLIFLVYIL